MKSLLHESTPSRLGEVAVLPYLQKPTKESRKRKKQRNILQKKNKIKLKEQILTKWRYVIYLIKGSKL